MTSSAPDSATLLAALAHRGVQVPELLVHHAGADGTIYRFDVEATRAVATWEALRPLADELGHYPLVCRDGGGLLAEMTEFNPGPVAYVVRVAEGIDPAAWFAQREADDPDYYGEVEQGEWRESAPQAGWTIPFDVQTGEPAEDVWIALVPTTTPWKALAYMRYGGWNECPAPEEHVALQRYWYERHGAEIVCLSGDTVEMRVARPPRDRDGAAVLAREQFLYSGGDLVYQGYESLNRLAAALVDARYWFFWWD